MHRAIVGDGPRGQAAWNCNAANRRHQEARDCLAKLSARELGISEHTVHVHR